MDFNGVHVCRLPTVMHDNKVDTSEYGKCCKHSSKTPHTTLYSLLKNSNIRVQEKTREHDEKTFRMYHLEGIQKSGTSILFGAWTI